jgi:glycosyltransferase involved in cell wall biosynthesis
MATSAALADGNADTPSFMAATDTAAARAMEARCMAGFDHIITFTEDDQQALWQQDASLPISVSPFPIPADCTIVPPAEVHRWDLRLVYVGSALWYPNVQAVQWFSNRVYPLLLEQLPAEACRLQVVGHWPEAQRQSLPQESVHFLGYAEQIAAVLSGNISINPVFTGAGLRTKLLASAACTSPIVSTSIGCEGMGLMRDQSMAALLATRAFEAALQTFGPEAVRQRRNRIYAEVCGQFAAGS